MNIQFEERDFTIWGQGRNQ